MDLQGLQFTKMHGLGNDFIVIDALHQPFVATPETVRQLSDRHYGIGCDQLLLVERATGAGIDFRYRIFNADGGEVEQCGNGARCFARYVVEHGLAQGPEIWVETLGGRICLYLEEDGQVRVDMGVPQFEPEAIPFEAGRRSDQYELEIGDETVEIAVASMGNPHAVLRVDDVDTAPVSTLGPLIGKHRRFPRGVNVGFMQVLSPRHIRLRVHERGAGETLACGTGACAAVAVGRHNGWLDASVMVDLPGGRLIIGWEREGESIQMTGPATTVYEGRIA